MVAMQRLSALPGPVARAGSTEASVRGATIHVFELLRTDCNAKLVGVKGGPSSDGPLRSSSPIAASDVPSASSSNPPDALPSVHDGAAQLLRSPLRVATVHRAGDREPAVYLFKVCISPGHTLLVDQSCSSSSWA